MLEVRGRRLEARRIDGPEPVVVFLHEGLGSAGLWRDVPDRICAETGRGGLIYSRAGYGASDPVELPRPLSYLDDEAALLPAVLDAAGIERAVLVGHSDGASIALAAAADDARASTADAQALAAAADDARASTADAQALAAAADDARASTADAQALAAAARAEGPGADAVDRRILGVAALAPHVDVEAANVEAIRQTGRRYRTSDLRERLARHHDRVDVAFRGWHDAWVNPDFARWSIVPRLADITVPLLVVQGDADPYGSLRQARLIEQHVRRPVEVVVLGGCAHTPQRERPAEMLSAVTRLIRRAAPPCRG